MRRVRSAAPKSVSMPSFLLPPLLDGQQQTRSANLLLAAVPETEYEDFAGLLETHPLRMRETLQEAGDAPEWLASKNKPRNAARAAT